MKKTEFLKAIRNVPQYRAFFKLVKVPEWMKYYDVRKGDEFMFVRDDRAIALVRDGRILGQYGIGSSFLQFLEYRKVSGALANF